LLIKKKSCELAPLVSIPLQGLLVHPAGLDQQQLH